MSLPSPSKAMCGAIQSMWQQATEVQIGLVMRLDEDDELIHIVMAEQNSSAFHGGNPPKNPLSRPEMTRYAIDSVKSGGSLERELSTSDERGFHAEELMILAWETYYLKDARVRRGVKYQPGIVDLVISKSPCHGSAASSALKVQYQDKSNFKYGLGCCQKLIEFAQRNSNTRFRIFYLALAGSKSVALPSYIEAQRREVENKRLLLALYKEFPMAQPNNWSPSELGPLEPYELLPTEKRPGFIPIADRPKEERQRLKRETFVSLRD